MAETNQEYIDQLITFIENTNDPDSITNVMVAVIFAFLNNRCKSLQTSQTETADNLTAEATVRSSADNELRARTSTRFLIFLRASRTRTHS